MIRRLWQWLFGKRDVVNLPSVWTASDDENYILSTTAASTSGTGNGYIVVMNGNHR